MPGALKMCIAESSTIAALRGSSLFSNRSSSTSRARVTSIRRAVAGARERSTGPRGGGLIAVDRAARQCGVEYLLEPRRKVQIGPHLDQLGRLVGEALDHRLLHGIGGEGQGPRQHVEEHQAQ